MMEKKINKLVDLKDKTKNKALKKSIKARVKKLTNGKVVEK